MRWLLLASLAASAAGLGLILLAGATRGCRLRRDALAAQGGGTAVPARRVRIAPPAQPGSASMERTRAGIAALLSRDAALGFVFLPVLGVFLILNSRLLGEAFEDLLNASPVVVGVTAIFGVATAVTDLQLYGLALSIALVLLGSGYHALQERRSASRWFVLLGGVVPLVAFEVWISGYRGYARVALDLGNSPGAALAQAVGGGLWGYVCAMTEAAGGYWAIHSFVVPVLSLIAALLTEPWVACWRAWRAYRQRAGARRPERVPAGVIVRIGAWLDETLFEPLRALDRLVLRLLRRHFPAVEERHVQ